MSNPPINEDAVRQWLKEFPDPETGRSVVSTEQVHRLEVADNRVQVTLGLTSFAAAVREEIRVQLIEHLRSRLPAPWRVEVELAEHTRPAEKIGEIGLAAKAVVAVGSGKGGVGKSTVAAFLAFGLARSGSKVGLMDADVYGPSIPHLLGSSERPVMVNNRIQPIEVGPLKVMSMGFLVPPDEAMIWRGPMLHGAITQFLRDTDWGELDYLIIDMPPGTGDIALTLSQLLPLSGAVVVCTPQDVALLDATKAITMFRRVNIDVLGVVENMSHFTCPSCGARHEIFGSGGAHKRADELKVPFLGEIPINIQIRILGDRGQASDCFDDPACEPFLDTICRNLVRQLVDRRKQQPSLPSLTVLK